MIEENVVSAAGTTHRASTDDFMRAIKALGKTPVQRDTLYRDVKTWNYPRPHDPVPRRRSDCRGRGAAGRSRDRADDRAPSPKPR